MPLRLLLHSDRVARGGFPIAARAGAYGFRRIRRGGRRQPATSAVTRCRRPSSRACRPAAARASVFLPHEDQGHSDSAGVQCSPTWALPTGPRCKDRFPV